MNHINPARTETLTQLMLGGLPTGRVGSPLYASLRYFDPARQRAGIPEDVAALVEKLSADETVVSLVNVSQLDAKTVVVQGGGYGEHQIQSVTVDGAASQTIDGNAFTVKLGPGCGATLSIKMTRYANQPQFAFPWDA